MAVQVPTAPELSAKLQKIVAELKERNGQYLGPQYSSITVTIRCDAEGYDVRDWWISAPTPSGSITPAPPLGVKASTSLTATTTAGQCDTKAAAMIAAVKAVVGPKYIDV